MTITRDQLLAERILYCATIADVVKSALEGLTGITANSSTERCLRIMEASLADALDQAGRLKEYGLPSWTAGGGAVDPLIDRSDK